MKTRFIILGVAGFVSASVFSSCNSPEKKVEDAAENVAKAQDDLNKAEDEFAQEWEKFKAENELQLQDNENQIQSYREMERKDQTWSNKYKTRIDELEAKNTALREKMNDYDKTKARDKWDSFKAEFKHDMDELGTALRDFGRDNKK